MSGKEVAEKSERTPPEGGRGRPGSRKGHASTAPGRRAEDADDAADLPAGAAGCLMRRGRLGPTGPDTLRVSQSVVGALVDELLGPTAPHTHRVSKLIKDPVVNVFNPPVDAQERIWFVPTFYPELCDPGQASGSHL